MLPTAHFFLSILIGRNLGIENMILLLVGSFFPDMDILFKKHRKLSHDPLVYLLVVPFIFFWWKTLFFITGIYLHLFLDSLDWGIEVTLLKKKVGPKLIKSTPSGNYLDDIKVYLSNKFFFFLEISLILVGVGTYLMMSI